MGISLCRLCFKQKQFSICAKSDNFLQTSQNACEINAKQGKNILQLACALDRWPYDC